MIRARSESDRQFAAEVSRKAGFEVGPWKIEAWRQAGLIQSAARKYPGRGSVARYPPESLQQAVEVARLSKKHCRHDEQARILFVRRLYVREPAIRQALVAYLDRLIRLIGPADTEVDKDRLARLALRVGKGALRTHRGKVMRGRLGGDREGVADAAYTLLHTVQTGEITTEEGLSQLLEASGLVGLFRDHLESTGPIAPNGAQEVAAFLQEATLPAIRKHVLAASWEDLVEARDATLLFLPFIRSFAVAVPRTFGHGQAFGFEYFDGPPADELELANCIPMVLYLLPLIRTEGGQTVTATIREQAPRYHAMAELATLVPTPILERLMEGDSTAVGELAPEVQDRLKQLAADFVSDNC